MITIRLRRLYDEKKLVLTPNEPDKINVCIVCDAGMFTNEDRNWNWHYLGSDLTKLGVFILNIDKPNNPRNLILCGIYKGSDTSEMLNRFFALLFAQLNHLDGKRVLLDIETPSKEVEFLFFFIPDTFMFVTGDMVFLLNVYGRAHSFSTNCYCLYCLADKRFDKKYGIGSTSYVNRTIEVNRHALILYDVLIPFRVCGPIIMPIKKEAKSSCLC